MLFGCLRQNINHSSEKLRVIYINLFFMQEMTINLKQVN